MDINYDIITLFQNKFILRRSRVINFAHIVKISMVFLRKPLKTQKNCKELKIVY